MLYPVPQEHAGRGGDLALPHRHAFTRQPALVAHARAIGNDHVARQHPLSLVDLHLLARHKIVAVDAGPCT